MKLWTPLSIDRVSTGNSSSMIVSISFLMNFKNFKYLRSAQEQMNLPYTLNLGRTSMKNIGTRKIIIRLSTLNKKEECLCFKKITINNKILWRWMKLERVAVAATLEVRTYSQNLMRKRQPKGKGTFTKFLRQQIRW